MKGFQVIADFFVGMGALAPLEERVHKKLHSRSRMSRNGEESLRDISKRRKFSVLKLGKLGYKGNLLSRFEIAR